MSCSLCYLIILSHISPFLPSSLFHPSFLALHWSKDDDMLFVYLQTLCNIHNKKSCRVIEQFCPQNFFLRFIPLSCVLVEKFTVGGNLMTVLTQYLSLADSNLEQSREKLKQAHSFPDSSPALCLVKFPQPICLSQITPRTLEYLILFPFCPNTEIPFP